MFYYIVLLFLFIVFILYYLNMDIFSFTQKVQKADTSDLESSINELKNLNQYIDNGNSSLF